MNMITIQFRKITRIRIQTLVYGLNYTNSIQKPQFNYQIIRSPLVQTIQKLSRQSGNCPDNPETVQTIQKQSGQSRNCPDNPETEFVQLAYNAKFKHFLSERNWNFLILCICHEFVDVAIYALYLESFAWEILLSGIFSFDSNLMNWATPNFGMK